MTTEEFEQTLRRVLSEHHINTDDVDQYRKPRESAPPIVKVAKKIDAIRSILTAVGVLVIFIGTAFVLADEVRKKPTTAEMEETVETEITPVRETAEAVKEDMEVLSHDLANVQAVQDFQVEQADYHGRLIEHVANRKRGAPPPKPDALKEKQKALMLGSRVRDR